jgi:hypothetical protein
LISFKDFENDIAVISHKSRFIKMSHILRYWHMREGKFIIKAL